MELHCDAQRDTDKAKPYGSPRCQSESDGPAVMVGNAQQSVSYGLKVLAAQAKALGWKRKKGIGWVCPNCLKMANR